MSITCEPHCFVAGVLVSVPKQITGAVTPRTTITGAETNHEHSFVSVDSNPSNHATLHHTTLSTNHQSRQMQNVDRAALRNGKIGLRNARGTHAADVLNVQVLKDLLLLFLLLFYCTDQP